MVWAAQRRAPWLGLKLPLIGGSGGWEEEKAWGCSLQGCSLAGLAGGWGVTSLDWRVIVRVGVSIGEFNAGIPSLALGHIYLQNPTPVQPC